MAAVKPALFPFSSRPNSGICIEYPMLNQCLAWQWHRKAYFRKINLSSFWSGNVYSLFCCPYSCRVPCQIIKQAMLPWKKDALYPNSEAPICLSCANAHVHTGPSREPTVIREAPRSPGPHTSPKAVQRPQKQREPKAAELYRIIFIILEPWSQNEWVLTFRFSPKLWPPDAKNWLTVKDPDAGKDWRREEKGVTEDEMVAQ